MKDNTLGLITLENLLNKDELRPFTFKFKVRSESFRAYTERNNKFISPILSIQSPTNGKDVNLKESQILLISAAGATGKSELVKQLSVDMSCPVIDLGKTDVVAGNSLTGTIFKNLEIRDAATFLERIKEGQAILLIDALDEGYQKTNTQGYFDYLKDLVEMLPGKGTPFVLFGRTNAVELAALYFEECKIRTSIIQIEPFTIEKAKEFIDKQIGSESIVYQEKYRETRDYIINSIGGFFKDQHAIKNKQYEHFIGYAPVLLAISTFFKEEVTNYQKTLEDLKKTNAQEISLVLDIVEQILVRDKEQKVKPNLLVRITKGRQPNFISQVFEKAYTPEEQCARVLYTMLQEEYKYKPINDEHFNQEYTKGLKDWIIEHPFLNGRKPSNIVFESYILARLISIKEYKDMVYRYLKENYTNSYMFFYIYHELNKESKALELSLLPYLNASIKALDTKNNYYLMSLVSEKAETGTAEVFFEGSNEQMTSYEYKVNFKEDEEIVFTSSMSDITIDAPITLRLAGNKIDITSPTYLCCKKIKICVDEINICNREPESKVVIEPDEMIVATDTGNYPTICNNEKVGNHLVVIYPGRVEYPFSQYAVEDYKKNARLTPEMRDAYQKLRRTLIMFRSHSKGKLAKIKAKIDNRIGKTDIGKKVIDSLLKKNIIYQDKQMYIINNTAMDKFLGVKFDGIRTCVMSDAILLFLEDCCKKKEDKC